MAELKNQGIIFLYVKIVLQRNNPTEHCNELKYLKKFVLRCKKYRRLSPIIAPAVVSKQNPTIEFLTSQMFANSRAAFA